MVPNAATTHSGLHPDSVTGSTTDENWFGYAANGSTYTSVESTWVQPAVDCSKGSGVAYFWVGLDGWTNSSVEQTGTDAVCPVFGQASYIAWWETAPNGPVNYSDTVLPGDTITAKVTFEGSDNYDLYLTDQTQGWTEDHVVQGVDSPNNSSAEVVGETPGTPIGNSGGGLWWNLPDFGTLTFDFTETWQANT